MSRSSTQFSAIVAVVLLDGKGFDRACFRRSTLDTFPPVYIESTEKKIHILGRNRSNRGCLSDFFGQDMILSARESRFTISVGWHTGNQRMRTLGLPERLRQILEE